MSLTDVEAKLDAETVRFSSGEEATQAAQMTNQPSTPCRIRVQRRTMQIRDRGAMAMITFWPKP